MLVLTRKTGQSIMIGDDIEVSVLAVSRDKIRIGITAPKEVPVFRKEVWISIKEGDAPEKGKDGAGRAPSQNGIEEAIIDGAAAKVEEALGRKE
ncbi:MAG: carbon storage regulator [Solirubrobacterales bacterium]|nr:carbon storage regulator [Solirubrobacterales bacterium]